MDARDIRIWVRLETNADPKQCVNDLRYYQIFPVMPVMLNFFSTKKKTEIKNKKTSISTLSVMDTTDIRIWVRL
jgi:hypothetical protein